MGSSILPFSDTAADGGLADGAIVLCLGYRLSDMPEDSDILAINWRGFPMPLEALVSTNKKIVHSVKDDDRTVEAGVRAYFQDRRCARWDSSASGQHPPAVGARREGVSPPRSVEDPT